VKGDFEMTDDENKVILYTTEDGKSQVSLMSRDGRVWLNQKQMAELFAVSKPNISMLIAKIFAEKELDDSVVKSYLTTAADGKRYNVIFHKTGRAVSDRAQEERLPRPQGVRQRGTLGGRELIRNWGLGSAGINGGSEDENLQEN
jgi:hypothetical protein